MTKKALRFSRCQNTFYLKKNLTFFKIETRNTQAHLIEITIKIISKYKSKQYHNHIQIKGYIKKIYKVT